MTLRCLEGGSWFKMGPFIEWFQNISTFPECFKEQELEVL